MTVSEFVVVVGSQNPSKLGCVQSAFERYAQVSIDRGVPFSFKILGIAVESGVSPQPKGHAETRRGALQRLQNAIDAHPDADFWVTLESGIVEEHEEDQGCLSTTDSTIMWEIGYAAVSSRQSQILGIPPTLTRNLSVAVPTRLAEMIRAGHEMGPACDQIWGSKNTGQSSGMIGHMTGGVIARADIAAPAIFMGLLIHMTRDQEHQ